MSRTDLDLFGDDARKSSRRRSIAGEGMVEPVKPITHEGQTLRAGRDRLAVEHPLVRAAPHLFAVCDASDRATCERMEAMQAAGRSTRDRITPTRTNDHGRQTSTGGLRLPGLASSRPLRLP
jgi:hypothetical protein